MKEYEKKILLTSQEYEEMVMPLCGRLRPVVHTNYYFDTDDFSMNNKGLTFRIRGKNGRFKATIKNHNTRADDCSIEEDLVEKTTFDPDIFNVLGLRYQGQLITERIVIHKDVFCKAVLDRNTYLGHTDFELEVEYAKGRENIALGLIENIAEDLLSSYTIADKKEFLDRAKHSKSKSQRFFERKLQGGEDLCSQF